MTKINPYKHAVNNENHPANQTALERDEKTNAEGIKWPIPDVLACSERPGFPNHTVHVKEVDQWLNP